MPEVGLIVAVFLLGHASGAFAARPAKPAISIRTEQYPRPPYSGATYYIYEQGDTTLCTKLEVCNKYGDCTTSYHTGRYQDPEDRETGEPYGTSPSIPIPPAKLARHVCIVRYRRGGL